MMRLLAPMLCLLVLGGAQDRRDPIRISGPPAIFSGGEAVYRLRLDDLPPRSKVVWHFSDAPDWIESEPPMRRHRRTLEGTGPVRLRVGKGTGEGRFTVSIVRGGRRIAQKAFRFLVVEPIDVAVRLRPVRHPRGGTRRSRLLRYAAAWPVFVAAVNGIYGQFGVRMRIGWGAPVKADDSLFDREGVFHPIARNYARKSKTAALNRLWRNNRPGAIDVYVVRNCHWSEKVSGGLQTTTVEHSLQGVGMELEGAVIDDSADVVEVVHELGHVLGLDDIRDPKSARRLMFCIRKFRTGLEVTYEEMKKVRATAGKFLRRHAGKR